MSLPSPTNPFHPLPLTNISLPLTPLTSAAFTFLSTNVRPSTTNHCLRSCAFALLLATRLPQFVNLITPLDMELVVVSILLHDMGWATNPELLSAERRFEVDGAEVARKFVSGWVEEREGKGEGKGWDKHRLQLMWDAIALHTTASIAMWKEPEVALGQLGIGADFMGVYLGGSAAEGVPGPLISVNEYKEIVTAFPREGFKDDLVEIMCGLCKTKPATTFDNFVGEFGLKFGLDGNGGGKVEYREEWERKRVLPMLLTNLDRNAQFEK